MVDRAGRRTVVRDGSLTANRPVRRVQRSAGSYFTAKGNVGTKKCATVRDDIGGGRKRNTETMSVVFLRFPQTRFCVGNPIGVV